MEKSTPMRGGEALLELFKIQEVDFIFCSPLSVWAPLWEALAKQKEIGKVVYGIWGKNFVAYGDS